MVINWAVNNFCRRIIFVREQVACVVGIVRALCQGILPFQLKVQCLWKKQEMPIRYGMVSVPQYQLKKNSIRS